MRLVFDCYSRGHRFESCRVANKLTVAQLVERFIDLKSIILFLGLSGSKVG